MQQKDILILSALLVGGSIVGWILRKWLLPLLTRLATKSKQQAENLILKSFKKWIIVLVVALGAYIGIKRLPLIDKYQALIDKSFIIFYILCATIMLSEIVTGMIRFKTKEADSALPSSSIIIKIIRVIVYGIGLVLILQSVGISVAPILTAMGVGGLAVALALQDTLSNLFAGLQIIASGKINQQDFIKLDTGQEGYVQDISWRITTIKNTSDEIIIVPNAKLSNMIVTNHLLERKGFDISVDISIDYNNDIKRVASVTKEVADQTISQVNGEAVSGGASVRFVRFGENSIEMKVDMQVNELNRQAETTHLFILNIQDRFKNENIRFSSSAKNISTEIKKQA